MTHSSHLTTTFTHIFHLLSYAKPDITLRTVVVSHHVNASTSSLIQGIQRPLLCMHQLLRSQPKLSESRQAEG